VNPPNDEQAEVVERKNPQDAARIEPAEIVRGGPCLKQYPRYKEAREHEEQVHACPAQTEGGRHYPVSQMVAIKHPPEVIEHHHQYGQTAQAV
jgi:hypothetical protein